MKNIFIGCSIRIVCKNIWKEVFHDFLDVKECAVEIDEKGLMKGRINNDCKKSVNVSRRLSTQLLELVCSALWDRMPEQEMFHSCNWHSLYNMAKVQTVVGLVADAISKLPCQYHPPKDVRMLFVGNVQQIERINVLHRAVAKKVITLLKENNIDTAFMKGITAGVRYPKPFLRQCGDIDFVVAKKDFQDTLKLLERVGRVDYVLEHEHHGMAFVDGVVVEPHYKVHNYQFPKNDKAMQKMFYSIFPHALEFIEIDGEPVPVYPKTFESVFLVSHMVNHVYEEGLGMRQVIDYAMFLYKEYSKIDKKIHQEYLEQMHMDRAHRIFVRICEKYFNLSEDICHYVYTDKEKTFADLLMEDILRVGNFGRGEYIFHRNGKWGDLQNYWWVARRSFHFAYLCPHEAYMWPISKFLRYMRKKNVSFRENRRMKL